MNPEHVEIVKQGKEAIDEWRLAHPTEGLDLFDATLLKLELSEVNLRGANLVEALLSKTNFFYANLSEACLRWAILISTDLMRSHLAGADLTGAFLFGADLREADMSGADASNADLTGANLVQANLAGAELTGAKLYGTARNDWNIEGIKCRFVFWDADGKERSPRNRDLEPGEFERIYAQLPTIEYVFENGINPVDTLVMDLVRRAVN